MAAFLGRFSSMMPTFLGVASKAGSFLGRAAPMVGNALNRASVMARNPLIQAAAGRVGGQRALNVMNSIAGGASNLGSMAHQLPGAVHNVVAVGGQVYGGVRNAYGNVQQAVNSQQSGVAAASKTNIIYPVAGASSYTPGGQLVFEIPAGEKCLWLQPENTFLSFSVTVSATVGTGKTAYWHAYPWDFIRSLELYASSGSVLCEQITNYGLVHSVCRDLQSDIANVETSDSLMLGADALKYRIPAKNTLAAGSASSSFTFAMPLISVIGCLSSGGQHLPLHAMSSPLRLSLQLNTVAAAIGLSGDAADVSALTYTVTNPVLSTSMLTLSSEAQTQIDQMTGGVYQWSGTSYHTYRTTHPAQQTSNTISIPARFTSVRAIMTAIRPTAQLESSLDTCPPSTVSRTTC
ncbi:hypothetical protein JKP88DRAFT_249429 [Tribonema minus]|uniref:Uncharacterized protein n=1 Tax=Tribonema minus TaxID=303371 RepID=A0A835YN70_9STRA|nr:hypothetical protein JKP88DRAFT_249429 [Tribonema minus]